MNFFRRSPPTAAGKDDDESIHEENSHGSEETDVDSGDEEETHDDDAAIAKPALDDYVQRPKEVTRQDSLEVVCADDHAIASAFYQQADLTSSASAVAVERENGYHVADETEEPLHHDDGDHDEESTGSDTHEESSVESEKRGWFSFLRRKKHDEISEDETESSEDETQGNEAVHEQAAATLPESTQSQQKIVEETAGEEEITQAIQRVQQRISEYRRKQEASCAGLATDDFHEPSADKPDDNKTLGGIIEADAKNANHLISSQYVSPEAEVSGQTEHEQEASAESTAETLSKQHSAIDSPVQDEIANSDFEKNETKGDEGNDERLDNDVQEQQEEDDDDSPTLQERRSLLSLAAEHNRVDVIKELVSMTTSDLDRTSLLQGVGGHTQLHENDPKDHVLFVPPPLHAAVAHGSTDAASCLLRMGADPSLRPLLPAMDGAIEGLHRSDSNAEQDRNYKKYHGRSAWELAFGAVIKMEPGCEENNEEVERTSNRGWFGFGVKEEEFKPEVSTKPDGVRYKKISGLNIPSTKLDGIRHAFTAEALRAIGSDEVHRLSQLLEAGMTPDIEVAGKTLKKWAGEMDAVRCLALMMQGGLEEVSEGEDGRIKDEKKELTVNEENIEPLADERLAGLSHDDIVTLIRENESLIPALTSCRDDLAEETDVFQSMLRDIQATGGKGGLSSRSLLDLVRSLKDERQELEESYKQWHEMWEEREDELDFFWEEAIEEEMREELMRSGVLDGVTEPMLMGPKTISSDSTLQELAHRYFQADNRVAALRSSIASLAEESGCYRDQIEKSGMSGALSLVKSLRSEVKQLKEKVSQAQAGESTCRRKIELIQRRIGHPVNGDVEELGDFQLEAIVSRQEGGDRNQSPLLGQPTLESTSYRVPTSEVFSHQPNIFHEGGVGKVVHGDDEEEGGGELDADHIVGQERNNAADVGGNDSCNHNDVDSGSVTDKLGGGKCAKDTPFCDDAFSGIPAPEHVAIAAACEVGFDQVPENSREEHDITVMNDNKLPNALIRPSVMLESGMSTAIVVKQPNGKASSLSFQIWDLLRRIVGLGRPSLSATSGHQEFDVTNSRHIMIV